MFNKEINKRGEKFKSTKLTIFLYVFIILHVYLI